MSQIQPYGAPVTSPYSRTGREISRVVANTEVAVVHTAAIAQVESAKLDALTALTGQAMQGVAMVSQLEQSLVAAVPHASGRLQAIADMHALSSAEVVAGAPRRLSWGGLSAARPHRPRISCAVKLPG